MGKPLTTKAARAYFNEVLLRGGGATWNFFIIGEKISEKSQTQLKNLVERGGDK